MDKQKKHLNRKERAKWTLKQKKEWKEMQEIESRMQEAAAEQSKEERKVVQTDILRTVFVTYFRIVKKARRSPLLPLVLEGIAKYSRYISLDFTTDIVHALKDLIADHQEEDYENQTTLSACTRLQCAVSALEMLQKGGDILSSSPSVSVTLPGNSSVLNVDLKEFYGAVYAALMDVPTQSCGATEGAQLMPILLRCVSAISNDKKQMSINRLAAFVKRISTIALYLPPNGCLAVMAVIADILRKQPKLQTLIDKEEQTTFGVYMPNIDDPEHCNALASNLWELPLLLSHYHPQVVAHASNIITSFSQNEKDVFLLKQKKIQHGKDQHANAVKNVALYSQNPHQLFKAYDASRGGFNPPIPVPKPQPFLKSSNNSKQKANTKNSKPRRRFIVPITLAQEPSAFMAKQQLLVLEKGLDNSGKATTSKRSDDVSALAKELSELWTQKYSHLVSPQQRKLINKTNNKNKNNGVAKSQQFSKKKSLLQHNNPKVKKQAQQQQQQQQLKKKLPQKIRK